MEQNISFLDAIILGVIQGATEFLPVSSSGHLAIAEKLLKVKQAGILSTEVFLHLGTLFAVLFLFRKEIFRLITPDTMPRKEKRKWLGILVIGTLPAAIAGLFLENLIAPLFDSTKAVGGFLIITGGVLYCTRFLNRPQTKPLNYRRAFFVGLAQSLALAPGISRSGMTITAGMAAGLSPAESARFSFLLSIPIIAGAVGLELFRGIQQGTPALSPPLLVGILTSGIVGFVAISWLVRLIQGGKFHHFSYYCWALGIAILLFNLK